VARRIWIFIHTARSVTSVLQRIMATKETPIIQERRSRRRVGRTHLFVFLAGYLLFAGLTGFVLSKQSPSDRRENLNVAATLGAVSGPLTGAIARNFQSCCLEFSMKLLPYCAGVGIAGLAFHFLALPDRHPARAVRLAIWALAVFVWFGGGVLSLGHALS